MNDKPVAESIAVDWGLSRMRLWALRDGKIIGETESETGAGVLTTPADYESALIQAASPWLPKATKGGGNNNNAKVGVWICGMAGARDGWQQTPYQFVPCPPLAKDGMRAEVPTKDKRIKVWILPGLAQQQPPNVMRGEETQIAGFLATMPNYDGAICLPGSHAKWARVKGGIVRHFDTMMTGELYALLSGHSALRHCLGGGLDNKGEGKKSCNKNKNAKGANDNKSFNNAAFAEAAAEAMRRPSAISSKLFSVRAESIIRGLPPKVARARLSGLCIGADIAAATKYLRTGKVAIIGAEGISQQYQTALQLRGITPTITNGKTAALSGIKTISPH